MYVLDIPREFLRTHGAFSLKLLMSFYFCRT